MPIVQVWCQSCESHWCQLSVNRDSLLDRIVMLILAVNVCDFVVITMLVHLQCFGTYAVGYPHLCHIQGWEAYCCQADPEFWSGQHLIFKHLFLRSPKECVMHWMQLWNSSLMSASPNADRDQARLCHCFNNFHYLSQHNYSPYLHLA